MNFKKVTDTTLAPCGQAQDLTLQGRGCCTPSEHVVSKRGVRISPPLEADLYTQISKHLVNKTLLIVEDCNKQDEKGRKRKVKGGKYERRLKKCQGTHKKDEKGLDE